MSLRTLTAARIAAPVGPGLFSSLMASMDHWRERRALVRGDSRRGADAGTGVPAPRSDAKTPVLDASFSRQR